MAQQQLQSEYDKVKTEEMDKSQKLQELMSVDVSKSKKLTPYPDNKSTDNTVNLLSNPIYIKKPKTETWVEFIQCKSSNSSNSNIVESKLVTEKSAKNEINNFMKLTKNNYYSMSIFQIHTFHLHLFISLTLLLVTHKCPHYILVI